jgi:hypothetical protein
MTPSMICSLYDEVVLVVEEALTPTNHRLLCCLRQHEAINLLPTIQAFAETGVLRGLNGEEPEKI